MSHPAALPYRPDAGRQSPRSRSPAEFVACAVAAASAALATVGLADGAGERGDLSAHDPAVTEAVVSHRTPVLTVLAKVVTAVGSEISMRPADPGCRRLARGPTAGPGCGAARWAAPWSRRRRADPARKHVVGRG